MLTIKEEHDQYRATMAKLSSLLLEYCNGKASTHETLSGFRGVLQTWGPLEETVSHGIHLWDEGSTVREKPIQRTPTAREARHMLCVLEVSGRTAMMLEMRADGKPLREIGEKCRITGNRVGQLLWPFYKKWKGEYELAYGTDGW